MDQLDPTPVLFEKVKSLDSENAKKILGYILIQDLKEGDLATLAFGPETLLQSMVMKAKLQLGLSSNTYSSSPVMNQHHHSYFSRHSPRMITNNGAGPGAGASSVPGYFNLEQSDPKASPLLYYDAIGTGSSMVTNVSQPLTSSGAGLAGVGDLIDECQFNDYLSFLNESSSKNEDFVGEDSQLQHHRRSFSASEVCFGSEEGGFGGGVGGFAPCHYFAKGFCKNGDSCKFVHGDFSDAGADGVLVGSPSSKLNGVYMQLEELMRLKAEHQRQQQQQRLAASQFAAAAAAARASSVPYDKRMDYLWQHSELQRRAVMMLGDNYHKFGCPRADRNDMLALGLAEKNSASKQIYLTFPADSSFKDEDVSTYFSIFGPVQDVRIPYQQRRMFGFVTFHHPETVKLVLARGNPHFICDSRVLVKPYKEKGKVVERRQQQFERGNYSPCSSPSGVDSPDSYELQLGNYFQNQEILRRKEDQYKLQQTIEFQRRRMQNLQLPDLKNSIHHHQRSLSLGSPVGLHSHDVNQKVIIPCDVSNQEMLQGESSVAKIESITDAEQHPQQEVNFTCQNHGCGSCKESPSCKESNLHEHGLEGNAENTLPDALFTSTANLSLEDQIPHSSLLGEVSKSSVPASLASETSSAPASLASETSPAMTTAPTTNLASSASYD